MTPPAAAAAIPATRPAPARPSRPPAPHRRPTRSRPARTRTAHPRRTASTTPVARAETAAVGRLLDRLIRSRLWIALVAFALIGIVAMQLWLLKLNGGIGRALEHEALLQRENAALSAENSALSAGDLVESHAVAAGMTVVSPGALVFLHTRGTLDERLAAARLSQPAQKPAEASGAAGRPGEASASGTAGQSGTGSQAVASATAQPESGVAPEGTSGVAPEGTASAASQAEPQG